MRSEELPEGLDVQELCRRCRERMARRPRGVVADDPFCIEVMRRGVGGEPHCRSAVEELYANRVSAWLRQAGDGERVQRVATARIWQRFWEGAPGRTFIGAEGLVLLLRFLEMCVWSVVADARRARLAGIVQRWPNAPVDSRRPAGTPDDLEGLGSARQLADAQPRDEHERELMHLHFELGLSSEEVHAHRPDLFPTVDEVYRLSRNIFDRLKRDDAGPSSDRGSVRD